MARRIKILNYAVNGSGLGHVTRLIAINRWIDRLSIACGVEPEIYFLTTSEADSLVWRNGFASFKIPSKTSVKDSRIPIENYLRMARQWVWNALNLIQPDLLIVDTFPNGSFGELVNALDLARHKAFIYREMKLDFSSRPAFQAMLPLYDQILVPHAASEVSLTLPERIRRRTTFTGPILVRDREELLPRDEARTRLGIPSEKLAVYLSAGGGGDDTADTTLTSLMDALGSDPSLHLVVGAGPLYRGVPRRGPHITWLTECDTVEMLSGIDLAVTAAGYNTFSELMFLGIPTVFYAQEKVADIQDKRLARAVAQGAAAMLPLPFTAEQARDAVAPLKEEAVRETMSAAARKLVPKNAARTAAAQLLTAVLPAEDVEEALESITPKFLARLRRLNLPLETGVHALKVLGAGHSRSSRRTLRLEAQALFSVHGLEDAAQVAVTQRYPDDLEGGVLAQTALRQLDAWAAARIPPAEGLRLTELVLKRARLAHREEASPPLRTALDALLLALAPFQDWRGAGLFIQALSSKSESLIETLEQAVGHLETHRVQGDDLYRAMATLGGTR